MAPTINGMEKQFRNVLLQLRKVHLQHEMAQDRTRHGAGRPLSVVWGQDMRGGGTRSALRRWETDARPEGIMIEAGIIGEQRAHRCRWGTVPLAGSGEGRVW